jgi:NAD(P)-dependent dehydrogenase (short-subunit alcohol dehydrogenase family)
LTLAPAVLPALRAGNGGYVVNISIVGLPFSGLYCATKFALEDMSESLRLERGRIRLSGNPGAPRDKQLHDHARREVTHFKFPY